MYLESGELRSLPLFYKYFCVHENTIELRDLTILTLMADRLMNILLFYLKVSYKVRYSESLN